ncbi:MAG: DUF2142 domain-containing protein [Bacteroidia bacterium]|nr:DUF2142 domain-containing protein [Bacteroidia bacterium]
MNFIKHIKPASFFLWIGLFFGSLHFFINPPLQAPDEFNHFCRAYQVSKGQFIAEKTNHRLGGHLPKSFQSFFVTYRFAATHPEYRFNSFLPDETSTTKLNADSLVFTDFANTSYYSAVSYAPQALIMLVLRPFVASPAALYFTGRFFVFLFWLLGIYFAIKRSPVFKWLLCLLALLPMNLLIANSFSADNVTNVLAFWWIAWVLHLAYNQEPLTGKKQLFLMLLAAALALAKLVYVGLFILLLLIPASNFKNRKQQFLSFAFITLPAMVLAWWWSGVAAVLYIPFSDYDPEHVQYATLAQGNNYSEQLKLILSDKTYFLKVIYNSIFNSNQIYLSSYIGVFGAYMAYQLPLWLYVMAYSGILIITLSIETPVAFSTKHRLIFFGSAFVTLVLLLFSLHLIWDPVGSGFVWLLQGRYLVPIVPLFLISLSGSLNCFSNLPKLVVIVATFAVNSAAAHCIYKQFIAEKHPFVYRAFSGMEEKNDTGDFVSNNPLIWFANQSNQSSIQKRHGNYSAMLCSTAPFGLACELKNVCYDDIIEVDFWKKGNGGVAIIAGGGKNCKEYTAPNAGYDFVDEKGWKKVHYLLHITSVCDSSKATFYMYQPDNDTVFVDDIKLTFRTREEMRK